MTSWPAEGSGADSVGSWAGAGSGTDSVGSRTGAGSGTDSVGSRTGAGSGTGSWPAVSSLMASRPCGTEETFLLLRREWGGGMTASSTTFRGAAASSAAFGVAAAYSATSGHVQNRTRVHTSHDDMKARVQHKTVFLVQSNNDCITEVLREFSRLPAADEEFMEFGVQCWASILPYLGRDAINSCSFSTLQLFNGFLSLL